MLKDGVWQGGVALAADATGNVYFETGDGPLDANSGGADYGDSVVKVGTTSSPPGLTILDYFSPSSQARVMNAGNPVSGVTVTFTAQALERAQRSLGRQRPRR